MKNGDEEVGEVIDRLSSYVSNSDEAQLPPEVIHKAKHHILDTRGAIVCGSNLKPNQCAKKVVIQQRGTEEAQIAGSSITTKAIHAAFAMAMMTHSDETDDSHERAGIHPGCSVIPAPRQSPQVGYAILREGIHTDSIHVLNIENFLNFQILKEDSSN
jgi:2-methylcitrate dehydratase PrpD